MSSGGNMASGGLSISGSNYRDCRVRVGDSEALIRSFVYRQTAREMGVVECEIFPGEMDLEVLVTFCGGNLPIVAANLPTGPYRGQFTYSRHPHSCRLVIGEFLVPVTSFVLRMDRRNPSSGPSNFMMSVDLPQSSYSEGVLRDLVSVLRSLRAVVAA